MKYAVPSFPYLIQTHHREHGAGAAYNLGVTVSAPESMLVFCFSIGLTGAHFQAL